MNTMARELDWDVVYRKKKLQWRGSSNFNPEMPKGSRFLEVGCGNGKNITALLACNFDLYAIDSSAHAIEQAAELVKDRKGTCKLDVQDIRALPYEDGFFDGIACFHTIGNLLESDRKIAAKELSRVLKKGGTLFFRDFGTKDFRNGKGDVLEERTFRRRTGIVTHYFTQEEVRDLFSMLEFKSEESEQFFVHYDGKKLLREKLHAQFVKK